MHREIVNKVGSEIARVIREAGNVGVVVSPRWAAVYDRGKRRLPDIIEDARDIYEADEEGDFCGFDSLKQFVMSDVGQKIIPYSVSWTYDLRNTWEGFGSEKGMGLEFDKVLEIAKVIGVQKMADLAQLALRAPETVPEFIEIGREQPRSDFRAAIGETEARFGIVKAAIVPAAKRGAELTARLERMGMVVGPLRLLRGEIERMKDDADTEVIVAYRRVPKARA